MNFNNRSWLSIQAILILPLRKIKSLRDFSPTEISELASFLLPSQTLSKPFRSTRTGLLIRLAFLRPFDSLLIASRVLFDHSSRLRNRSLGLFSPFAIDILQVACIAIGKYQDACLLRRACIRREFSRIPWSRFEASRLPQKRLSAMIEYQVSLGRLNSESRSATSEYISRAVNRSLSLALQARTDSASAEFKRYVAGKSIALVGPSPSEEPLSQGKIIDRYDIVVRLNDPSFYAGFGRLGSRTEIVYFNGAKSLKFLTGSQILPQDLRFVVFKASSSLRQFRDQSGCAARVCSYPFNSYRSHYNMIQVALLDLLLFSPSRIDIFATNLWLNPVKIGGYQSQSDLAAGCEKPEKLMAAGGYGVLTPEHSGRIKRDFTHHNPFSQFSLLKFFYSQGVIGGDDQFLGIMNLTLEEYSSKLEEIYSTSPQDNTGRY